MEAEHVRSAWIASKVRIGAVIMLKVGIGVKVIAESFDSESST